jgi:hypothetical protein
VTTDGGVARDNILPMEYSEFDKVCKAGDTLFVGRYLTNGADISSVYMDVSPSPSPPPSLPPPSHTPPSTYLSLIPHTCAQLPFQTLSSK